SEPPGTRDGFASAVEGATRFRGRKPYSATRPPGARSASDPSTCQRGVCATPWPGEKPEPSRARDTGAGDRDGQGSRRSSRDGRDRSRTRDGATRRGAVRMAAITCGTNGKRPVTEPAGLLAKGYVHVGAAAHSDWTRGQNRDTKSGDPSRSVGASRRSPRVWR